MVPRRTDWEHDVDPDVLFGPVTDINNFVLFEDTGPKPQTSPGPMITDIHHRRVAIQCQIMNHDYHRLRTVWILVSLDNKMLAIRCDNQVFYQKKDMPQSIPPQTLSLREATLREAICPKTAENDT